MSNILTVKRYLSLEQAEQPFRNLDMWRLARWIYHSIPKPLIRVTFRLAEAVVQFVQPFLERYVFKKPVRFINVLPLMGHLALEPDTYLKEGILGRRPNFFSIMLMERNRISNPHLLTYIRQYITVFTNPFICVMLVPFSRMKSLRYDDVAKYVAFHTMIDSHAPACAIHREWGARPPLWRLRTEDRERGLENLSLLGLPAGAWYVCIHARTSGYDNHLPQAYRNVDIKTYYLAMNTIVRRGGWCIRMGDPSQPPLPPMEGVVDYCHSRVRSDWMDVFLCATCRFFLGSGSGLGQVPAMFGRPFIMANTAPFFHVIGLTPQNIGIPKLYWSDDEERLLTFREIAESDVGRYFHADLFKEAHLTLVDNSPDEVRDVALEMLDKLDGARVYTAEDEILQVRFRSFMKPIHHTYGAPGRVGRDFLRKYRALME